MVKATFAAGGIFSPVFTFLKEHSRGYVTEKRGEMAEKELFLTR